SLAGAEGGCEGVREVPVSVARAASQCPLPGEEPSVVLVTDAEGWRTAFPPLPGAVASEAPADFGREVVVVIGMGRRPTGGYAVELARPAAAVKDGIAAIQVAFRSPPPDAMTTQALTSPCLAVRLPREGVREVRIADERSRPVASAPLR
ncbi:MAG TPA: protease complex subunit PrcB family protein, partial [Anaeromyxobacteraceae bacterium]|nr:protease complex subunit PrcB family protein [Anaeromyxobacteraceae bacterium]